MSLAVIHENSAFAQFSTGRKIDLILRRLDNLEQLQASSLESQRLRRRTNRIKYEGLNEILKIARGRLEQNLGRITKQWSDFVWKQPKDLIGGNRKQFTV